MGAKCIFSYDTLDIENVFVNSAHAYEVFLENKGDIEATYTLLPSTSLFGPNFTFAPNNGTLQPGKLQAIQVWVSDKTVRFREVSPMTPSDFILFPRAGRV